MLEFNSSTKSRTKFSASLSLCKDRDMLLNFRRINWIIQCDTHKKLGTLFNGTNTRLFCICTAEDTALLALHGSTRLFCISISSNFQFCIKRISKSSLTSRSFMLLFQQNLPHTVENFLKQIKRSTEACNCCISVPARKFYRMSHKNSNRDLIKFGKELEHIRLYFVFVSKRSGSQAFGKCHF